MGDARGRLQTRCGGAEYNARCRYILTHRSYRICVCTVHTFGLYFAVRNAAATIATVTVAIFAAGAGGAGLHRAK